MWNDIAEIDDIEFAQQMQSLKENKHGEDENRGMTLVEMTNLSEFPESVIPNILVKIPPRYIYKNFMLVCKAWKDMFSRSFFVERNFMESETGLLIQAAAGRYMKTKLIEIGKELECELRDLGITRLGEARSSCDGFLLMNEPGNNGKLQVINPTTKFSLTLPKCPSSCLHKACSAALGFDSLKKQYKVVHVVSDSYGFKMFNLGSLDNEWERVSGPWEDPDDRPYDPREFSWEDPVSINGRVLHWYVDSCEYIISMQVNEARFSKTYLPKLGKVIKEENFTLIELGGYLSFVYCDSDNKMDIWILEDFQGQVWTKKHTIVAELTDYNSLNKSASQYERTMPNLGKLVAVAGARNGEVLFFMHKNSNSVYIYDTKIRLMKKVSIKMKNLVSFLPHKDSLFSMKWISQTHSHSDMI